MNNTRMKETGEWIEPPRQITVIHVKTSEDPISHVPVDVAGHVKAADVPASEPDPDIMHIITPKPYSSRGVRRRRAVRG